MMIYPNGFRNIQRYRGPVESKKMLQFNEDIALNIDMLYNKFEELNSLCDSIKEVATDEHQFMTGRNLSIVSKKLKTFVEEAVQNG